MNGMNGMSATVPYREAAMNEATGLTAGSISKSATPRDVAPVAASLEVTDLKLNILSDMLSNLENKLMPVLGPDYDETGRPGDQIPASESSDVVKALNSHNVRLQNAIDRINRLTVRIEL